MIYFLKTIHDTKFEEIHFLLKDSIKLISVDYVREHVVVQPLKWVLAGKTNTSEMEKTFIRARIDFASLLSTLRQEVHKSTPTVILSTLRMLKSVLLTRMNLSENDNSLFSPVTLSFHSSKT